MLQDVVLSNENMLFRVFVARFLTVAQLRNLCRTSKDFCGMLIPCLPFCRDLQDEHLQDAFVVRLVNANQQALLRKIVDGNRLVIPGLDLEKDITISLHQAIEGFLPGRMLGCLARGASLSALVFGGAVMLRFRDVSEAETWIQGVFQDPATGMHHDGVPALMRSLFCFARTEEGLGRSQTIAKLLVLLGADPNIRLNSRGGQESSRHGSTPLLLAVEQGQTIAVEGLLKANADPNAQDPQGLFAVQLASDNWCYGRQREVAEVLCKHGAQGALWYAAKNNLRDMVAELIYNGHDLEECDKDGKTALELAAEANGRRGHGLVVGVLIAAGMAAGQDVNACLGSAGKTLMMYASQGGHEESVRALIEKGASLEAVDKNGKTVLMWASERGDADRVRVLVELGASVGVVDQKNGRTALMWAIENGNADTARVLVELGASEEAVDKDGKTALHYAADNGHGGIAEALLKAGCNPQIQDRDGKTALHRAVFNGHGGIAEAILKAGCNPQIQDRDFGRTALHYAASKGHGGITEALLKAGCNPQIQDRDGKTALHYATDNGHGGIAEAILKAGCNPQIQDKDFGRTALHYAASKGHGGIAEALLKAGCNPQIQDRDGWTALHRAAFNGNIFIAEALLKAGCNPQIQTRNLRTPLDLAVRNLKEEVAAVLRAHGALHSRLFAAERGMPDEVAARIVAGQDVNARDQNDWTALHYVADKGHGGGIAEALLKAGCNPDIQNTYGSSALHLAERNGQSAVVAMVKEHMASGGSK